MLTGRVLVCDLRYHFVIQCYADAHFWSDVSTSVVGSDSLRLHCINFLNTAKIVHSEDIPKTSSWLFCIYQEETKFYYSMLDQVDFYKVVRNEIKASVIAKKCMDTYNFVLGEAYGYVLEHGL